MVGCISADLLSAVRNLGSDHPKSGLELRALRPKTSPHCNTLVAI